MASLASSARRCARIGSLGQRLKPRPSTFIELRRVEELRKRAVPASDFSPRTEFRFLRERHMPPSPDSGRLLHGLNDGVEQHTIEARVLKADALLVVLDERVHGGPLDRWVADNSHRRWPAVIYSPPVNPGISGGKAACLLGTLTTRQ
jgi:hypothetical protein